MPFLQDTTGKSDAAKYVLGRGRLYFATLGADDLPDNGGWRFLGNVSEFSLNTTEEEIKHFSTQSGLKKVDRTAVLSQELSGQFSAEQWDMNNVADLLRGSAGTATPTGGNAAIGGILIQDLVTVASGGVTLGRWYDIYDPGKGPLTGRAYDIDSAKLTVKYDATTPSTGTTGVLNTDYELDSKMGRIFILSTGSISAADGISITLAADAGAKIVQEVKTLVAADVDGALKFIQENANDSDAESEWQFHKTKLRANGDLNLISDDWGSLPFKFEAEENEALGGAASPLLTIRSHANA